MSDQETQETKQHIQVIGIQLQTLATLDSVKMFLQLQKEQELLHRSLPKPDADAEESHDPPTN